MRYVDIVVDNKSEYTDTLYTYEAPDDVCVGDRVSVSFARRKKPVDGYVFAVDTVPGVAADKIKPVISIDKRRSLSPEMVDTAKWMIMRYGIKAIDAIKMFAVSGKREIKEDVACRMDIAEPNYSLTEEQQAALERINKAVANGERKNFLIKGVTNSGKTEVYIRTVEKALESGRSAIMLVPEIALAVQTEERFKQRFGADKVAVMHSKMPTSKRLKEWLKIRDGEAKVVIGARTAVFAPLTDIGIIIIDEEHEATYKSDHNPKYETIDLAFKRASWHNAVLVMGSATPSVVSYSRAKDGIYELIEMKERVGASVMPDVEIVDMCSETKNGNMGLLSQKLYEETCKCLSAGEQAIMFLNRRGFSTQVICLDCGYRFVCEDCGIAMTHHRRENALVCHYCGKKTPLPRECPSCGSTILKYAGTGTEKVEDHIQELFPDAKVARFDLDTAKTQAEIDKTIRDFQTGRTDILVGTQILAKGLDFRNVGLVGIAMADISMNIPDYRSAERTFQLITQVSGRAGRNAGKSKVIIQTYIPDDDVIRAAAAADYESFYESELLHRNIMNYPPFSDIIYVTFTSKAKSDNDASVVMSFAEDFRNKLLKIKDAPRGASILKPRQELIATGKDTTRVSFIIKAPKGSRSGYVRAYIDYKDIMIAQNAPCYVEIDVNPYGIV